ncbi:hypothetical protein PC128_g16973 [Phytophthora cactorum]|nr:hypothetical protein PC120_g23224 [Phytophthora cactorum]KAG3088256.1 hypothetical protein PC121_g4451 [Phytophthora cactorum]KAG3177177.1 hypothetical protein PC128_g16973 [Phytophthora cactorum]KAG4042007.1 hypothetical protein PC123_g22491 [Phytophthora cactorum]
MATSSPDFQEVLRDHARSLGVDPNSESYLLPLVQEALLVELPADWEQGETEDVTLYYFNSSTEESIWEHPLDAHYRELIQAKKEEHAAQPTETIPEAPAADTKSSSTSSTAVTSKVDVYSFDDMSDEETPTPAVSAPVSSKSRISDLFATPTQPTPARKTTNSTIPSIDSTSTLTQMTPAVATGFGFGRDLSWLLDNDDDVAPIAIKPLSTSLQKQDNVTDSVDATSSRLEPFSSRRSGTVVSTTITPTPSIDAAAALSSSQPTNQPEEGSEWPSKQSTTATTSVSSPTTTAKMQHLENKLADANSDLERERVAHSETTRKFQTAKHFF